MNPRFLLSLFLAPVILGFDPAPAQEPQDPDVVGPKPAGARLTELQMEKDRLVREIGYVRELLAKGGLAARVAAKLEERFLEPRAVDAGAPSQKSVPATAGVEPRPATLMTDEQREKFPPDVMLIVEGRPVYESAFKELAEYLRSRNPEVDDLKINSRVMSELIKTELAHSRFVESAGKAAEQIREIETSLGRGVEFEHLARNRSQHASASEGGDLGFLAPNSGHPLKLEQLAFATRVGAVTPVFRTPLGYNLLRVTEEKETDQVRMVRASLILIPYHEALDQVVQIQRSMSLGQVEITIRDDATRELLPPLYR